jgi:glutathione synthase/RimK-type ligase-like ATP-grasp enzyme
VPRVIIIAPDTDPHAIAVRDRIGTGATILDTHKFPEQLRMSLGDRPDEIVIGGERVRPTAVYVRDYGLNPMMSEEEIGGPNWRRGFIALRERSEMVHSLVYRWEQLGIPVYNPPTGREKITKPYQIGLLAAAGLPVPETRWTNDPDEVRRFAEGRRIAYKPVAGGGATKELEPKDFERLDRLAAAPVCFQELLPGQDVRVYVIDGRIACGIRIVTDAIDFRQNEKALEEFPVDDELRDICIRACQTLGLRFTGMDLKGAVDGKLRILELNPSPMFLGFDARAGTDILGALAAALRATDG